MNAHTPNQFLEFSNALKFEPFIFEPIDLSKMLHKNNNRETVLETLIKIDLIIVRLKHEMRSRKLIQNKYNEMSLSMNIDGDYSELIPLIDNSIVENERATAEVKRATMNVINTFEALLASIEIVELKKLSDNKIDSLVKSFNAYLKDEKNIIWLLKGLKAQCRPKNLSKNTIVDFDKLMADVA